MSKAIAFVRSGAAPGAPMEIYTDATDATVSTQWTAVTAGAFSSGTFNGISVKYAMRFPNCTVNNFLNDSTTAITASAVSPASDASTGSAPSTNASYPQGTVQNVIMPTSNLTLANGANNNVAVTGGYNRIADPTGVFNITGLTAGQDSISNPDGMIVILDNVTGQNMTITNASTGSAAGNRIVTPTGADVATTANGSVTLIYNAFDARWHFASALAV